MNTDSGQLPEEPRAFQASLKSKAGKAAAESGLNTGELIARFYHRVLMARICAADPDGWVLKGGQALLVRWQGARYSSDVDLWRTRGGAEEAVAALREAAATGELVPQIRFRYIDESRHQQERDTYKVRFEAYVGVKKQQIVSVDLATNLSPQGQPAITTLEPPFPVALDWPQVRMWPLEDHVADKIVAMYEVHPGNIPSSRVKDLVDLVLIAHRSRVDGATAHAAIQAEVARRRQLGTRVELPAKEFRVPDQRSWAPRYSQQAKKAADLPEQYHSLRGALPLARSFVSPLLRSTAPGVWVPETMKWT